MANQYTVIDESTWERSVHCMVFRNSVEPAFCVTFEADITNFRKKVKEEGISFTLAMVHAVCKCANEVEALRYRFLDGKIVLYEQIDTAFTYLNRETGLFKAVNAPFVTYTHVSHTNSGKKDNATPLFDWGKYYEKDGRVVIPVSIQAHHSFVDGIHVGQFVDTLQKYFDKF